MTDGEEGLRRRARVDAGGGGQIPGLERVVPGRTVGDRVVSGVESDVGDLRGVAGEKADGTALRAGFAVCRELAAFVGGGGTEVLRCGRVVGFLRGPETYVVVCRGGKDAGGWGVDSKGVDGSFVTVELECRCQCALLAGLLVVDEFPETNCSVGTSRDNLSGRKEFCGLDGTSVSFAGGDDVGARIPDTKDAVKRSRQDTRLPRRIVRITCPFGGVG